MEKRRGVGEEEEGVYAVVDDSEKGREGGWFLRNLGEPFSPVPRHLLEAARVRRCIEQAECAWRDARVSANSRQHGAAVRTIKKKIATALGGTEWRRAGQRQERPS